MSKLRHVKASSCKPAGKTNSSAGCEKRRLPRHGASWDASPAVLVGPFQTEHGKTAWHLGADVHSECSELSAGKDIRSS